MKKYDVIIVGGGPAGYIAAIKAARLGAKSALFEKSAVGGTCLNRGCIPAKTYLKTAEIIGHIQNAHRRGIRIADARIKVDMEKAVAEKNKVVAKLTGGVSSLLKSNGVDVYFGEAKIRPDKTVSAGETVLAADKVIFAGGSKTAKLSLPGMDSARVLKSDDIFDIGRVPESLAIIGGGVIGTEIASAFAAFGSRVTIIELTGNVLPMADGDISNMIRKSLEKKGVTVYTETKIERAEDTKDAIRVYTDKRQPVEAEYALMSVGRVPDLSAVEGLGLEIERGAVKTDDTMRTNIDWIWAPGDVNAKCMLAHAAFKMGETAAENAMGRFKKADLRYVPTCVYTNPEAGSAGLTERQAGEKYDISVGMFPFSANGRALASGETEGFVKIIADKKYGEVLGVHIVGPGAAEMINEAAALMASEITVNEIAGFVHGHPTYSEAFMEAAADSIGQCLHLPPKK